MNPGDFAAKTPFEQKHPSALAIYCSDGRFTQAVEELLAHLGHARLDTLTVPGGAALLNAWTSSLLDSDHVARAAKFLITGHDISHVVLVAHAGCGYYRQRYPGERDVKRHQLSDLRAAATALGRVRASLQVATYYAVPDGARVRFERVTQKD
jgi:carbonic anhydrase